MMHLLDAKVEAAFVDYNGHMNDASYARLFSVSTDALMAAIGLGPEGRAATGLTIYTLSMMIHYLHEARLGEPLAVSGQLLEHDEKRIRFWLELRQRETGVVLALSEQLLVCVDQSGDAPRSAKFLPGMKAALGRIAAEHAHLPVPERAGQGISLARRARR